jgi:hypothetical protein
VNENFISNLNGPCGLAVDADHIYWAEIGPFPAENRTTIGRANLDGPAVNVRFISGANGPCGVVLGG